MRSRTGGWLASAVALLLLSACAGAPPQQAGGTGGDVAVPSTPQAAAARAEPPVAVPEDNAAMRSEVATDSGEGGTGAPVRAPVSSAPAPAAHAQHAPAPAVEIPASPFVFAVTAAEKDTTHPFYGLGSKHGFLVNTEEAE